MSRSSSMELSSRPKAGGHHYVSDPITINQEELRFLYVSNVKVSNFVSVKQLNESNHTLWKEQMLCLLDSQNMRGLVDPRFKLMEVKSSLIMEQYKSLVKGWIYRSLNEDMLKRVINIGSGPQEIWSELETICDPNEADPTGWSGPESAKPGDGQDGSEPMMNQEELRFLYASNVNVANFVSVTMLDESNYSLWKKQMVCLLDSQNLRGFVDDTVDPSPEVKSFMIRKQYESLIEGWIFRSLSDDTHRKLRWGDEERSLWKKLEDLYGPEVEDPIEDDVLQKRVQDVVFLEQVEVTTTTATEIETPPPSSPSPDNSIITRNNKLVKAIVDGRWLEAKHILKNNKDAATEAISDNGYTMLHIAVIQGQNNFLERLLDFIDDENKIKVGDDVGWNALCAAAILNNKRAAQLLVKKCKDLLFNDLKPLEHAYRSQNLDTFLYLWEAVNDDDDEQGNKLEALNRTADEILRTIDFDILEEVISTKQYGLASRLVNTFPQVAMKDDRLLMAMARTFPSDLGFGEALIYPSLNKFHQRIVKRSSSLCNVPGALYIWVDDVLWATRRLKEAMWLLQETVLILLVLPVAVLYPLYQLIRLLILVILYPFFILYFLLWMVSAFAVMPIKRIEEKRKTYQEAKEFLNIICNHIDKLGPFEDRHPCYGKPYLEAVRQGAFEVVDEILYRSPKLIMLISNSRDKDNTFVELAVANRSEKIYNLIYHLDARMYEYRDREDFSQNNILHLAGRLAPEHILSRTTGAALQLQRELQWFQEVEKRMLPGDLLKKNADMETPQMVFSKQHADLVKEGEQWMKTTAEACSITAALIVTIVFAAAITVPGGNQESGTPLFKKDIAFVIFGVCDAISLFSSTSALLVFLSILTTRFAEMDFLVSLPRRLIIGLSALFLSTASMMVAFSAILFLVFCDQRPWMLAPIGLLTCMPIAVIVILQLPLLVDLFKSTYTPIFGKQKYIANGKFISNHPMLAYEL